MIPPISFAFVAALAFSGLNASVGYLTGILDIPVAQVILIRNSCIFILAICYTTILHVPQAPLGAPLLRKYLVIAGLGVAVSVMTSYQSMFYLTLSEFTSVRCMDPFATALLCRIFVNERFTRTQLCCCSLSIIGVILVTDPFRQLDSAESPIDLDAPTQEEDGSHLSNTLVSKLIGVLYCVPGMFGQATELVAMRKIGDQASSAQMIIYLAFCPSAIAGLYLASTRTALVGPVTLSGWVVLLGVVPLGFIGQYALTYAGQRVSGTQISIVMYFGVVSGTLLQWAIYGGHPSATAFIGMTIIVVCGIYAVVYGTIKDEDGNADQEADVLDEVDIPLLPAENR